jgi:hypothetical protein
LPSTSIDTFFACIIIVTAFLMATAFVTSTLQTTINSTQDINKEDYLKAIANNILTNSGTPLNWGKSTSVPTNFGLSANPSTIPYEIDLDKITRLNCQSNYSLSYFDIANSARLNNIALGISVSQIMAVNIQQIYNNTIGSSEFFTFAILTSIDSKPATANLHCYVVAKNYLGYIENVTSSIGLGFISTQIPTTLTENAMLIVFSRSSFDDRITSYTIYNFANSTEESAPRNDVIALSPLDYSLSLATNLSKTSVQDSYFFSYGYEGDLKYFQGSNQYEIPKIIDNSPFVLVICGLNNNSNFQEWTSYPQVPFKSGSNFAGSEQNVFSYIVTIKGGLYKLEISLGDVPK